MAPVGAEIIGLQRLPAALSLLWLVLVIPSTFAEPIGLKLRTANGDEYLHAQLFTGFMYIGGTLCLWFLRAWKIRELDRVRSVAEEEKRELEIRDDDMVREELGREGRPMVSRTHSRAASVRSKVKEARGFWTLQRV